MSAQTVEEPETSTTADERGELFGVHIPELQLEPDDYRAGMHAAALEPGEHYLELGSGHGRGLVIAAAEFRAVATGVEYLADANETARAAALEAGVAEQITIVRDDVRRVDPAPADVLHMHLGPAFHDLLAPRLERLLAPGTRVIAAGWQVPGWLPLEGALDAWDAGYVYRPADPERHLTWTGRRWMRDGRVILQADAHADLHDVEVRVDGAPGDDTSTSARSVGRGQQLLVEMPLPSAAMELSLWARSSSGRFTQRGTPLRVEAPR